jgi:hypothetical protein
MGTSTDALLMWGYDLGGGDDPWKVEGVDEYGSIERPWLGEGDDFESAAMKVLLATVGYTETEYSPGQWQREEDAKKRLGVSIEEHCSGSYPMWVLTAKTHRASRGECLAVDLTVDPAWGERLAAALKVLDLKPLQAEPCWLLASFYGI